ncbi:hypothetical protein VaNZ11_000876 [Volvox africanus]|uniref:RNA-editing substrate-binding complex 6 protein domain-containing protein n=1 Tax=Volvox africanus TaxID=51714 RepID=A0ABQ5RP18_9CHLO|nr:hypothetical protein VaNZ11_000876 [Volvox africanus]
MLSYRKIRSHVSGCRWGLEQAGNVPRSAVVGRLLVANATRLRAKAEAEDEETVFSVPSGLQLKTRRSRATIPQPAPETASAIEYTGTRLHQEPSVADAAALRDATATASTSTSTSGYEPPFRPQSSLKQRKLSLRSSAASTAASAATAAAAATISTSLSGILQPEEDSPGPYLHSGDSPTDIQSISLTDHDVHEAAAALGQEPLQQRRRLDEQSQPQHEQQLQPQHEQQPQPQAAHPLPAGVTPERDREIHNELRGCEEWRDVLDIVADEAACLSVRTAVQALTRLNVLTRGSVSERREIADHPAFQTLKEVLYSQVSLMNNVQLSNSLHALAQLQVKLPELLLDGYAEAAAARVDTFYPRDIATLLAAAAAMRWSPPREMLDTMGFRSMGLLTGQEFDARSIPTLLHSIALLGYKNPLLAEAAAQRLAAPGVMASLAPQGVANAMWALGRMDTYHPPAVEAALSAFSANPMSYKPQEVANLLWALTAFRHHPEGAFVLFARSLLQRQDGNQIRAADLATLLYAFALFNVGPGARVMERVEACAMRLLEEAAAAPQPPPQPRASPPRGGGRRGSISVVELAHMYWGLALLGAVEGPLFGRLEAELGAAWEREGPEIPQTLLRVTFQGFLASKLESHRRSHGFNELALDALKRAWVAGLGADSQKYGRGRRVDQLAAILDTLKVTYDKRRPTGDGLAIIDIALKAGPERYLALQVVDTADRCANSKQLLGQVVVTGQVLEKNGWEVRHLRASDLDSLTPRMQTRFVEDLLRGMGVRVRKASAAAAAAAAATSSSGTSAAADGLARYGGARGAVETAVKEGGAGAAASRALKTRSLR